MLRKEQTNAANAIVLPERVEKALDQEAWDNLGDAGYCAYMMVKESGLNVEEICALKIVDIQFGSEEEKAFISLQKNYSNSATHDYTFPLVPSGTIYLREYIKKLQNQYGENRVRSECYLISLDEQGTEPYSGDMIKKINDFFNEIIRRQKVGYAALAGLDDLIKVSKGGYLLRKTYENRMVSLFCGDGCLTCDDGAATFMTHRALVNSVQSDHYRAFTDETGRAYLFNSVMKDPRNPYQFMEGAEEKAFRRKSTKQIGDDQKLFTYPAKSEKGGQVAEITLSGLKPGDVITLEALHGLMLKVEKT